MSRRAALALILGCAVAAIVTSVALAAGNYKGDAQSIALTANQAGYKALTGSGAATTPPADKRLGYRSGWQASYLKGTVAKPVQALVLVYVYDTPANALRAYANSCPKCSKSIRVESVTMKYQVTTAKPPSVLDVMTCRNVYVAAVVSGNLKTNALADAAAALGGRVFAKAAANGMSACVK
jgi:hypothetical protein